MRPWVGVASLFFQRTPVGFCSRWTKRAIHRVRLGDGASLVGRYFRSGVTVFHHGYANGANVNIVFHDFPDIPHYRFQAGRIALLDLDPVDWRPMRFLRSERYAAFLLLGAAILGVVLANSPKRPALTDVRDLPLPIPWLGLHLSIGDWVKDGLLAVFFFLAAIELRHELAHGELNSARKALVPTVAAVGGVIVPALIFLLVVRDPALSIGWPVPTATDIAFALGALALVGRGLPSRVRALLLALAVIDDLIAIIIIAAFFTTDLKPIPLLIAVPVVLLFGWLSARARSAPVVAILIVLGLAAWVLVHLSGIHSTIAGVALGLIMAGSSAGKARHAL